MIFRGCYFDYFYCLIFYISPRCFCRSRRIRVIMLTELNENWIKRNRVSYKSAPKNRERERERARTEAREGMTKRKECSLFKYKIQNKQKRETCADCASETLLDVTICRLQPLNGCERERLQAFRKRGCQRRTERERDRNANDNKKLQS